MDRLANNGDITIICELVKGRIQESGARIQNGSLLTDESPNRGFFANLHASSRPWALLTPEF